MDTIYPEFVPDADLSREAMESLQETIADRAVFTNDLAFDPGAIAIESRTAADKRSTGAEPPVVAGIDQAFLGDRVVSAIVCLQGDAVVERVSAVTTLSFPYIPGLLSFREGGPILAAIEELTVDPDLLVFDGSGRIHFRQAGLATHIGLALDAPAIGVAKSLLCGTPQGSLDARPAGTRVPIAANEEVTAPAGTLIGYGLQTKQWDRSQSINPVFVSSGHRVGADTAADCVLALGDGYKLPEPVRLADAHAAEAKNRLTES